jgi:hypothetical protein
MTLGAGTDAARPGVRQNSQYGHKTNPPTGKRARIMAQKTVVTLYDDLDGSTEHVEPVSFALDGQTYDIDLSRVNAGTLREVLADYVSAGRKVTGSSRGAPRKRAGQGRARSAAIRDWARETGRKVSERGRIPAAIEREYDAAH